MYTKEEILKRALLKAFPEKELQNQKDLDKYIKMQIKRDDGLALIFYHPFAIAFFGEKNINIWAIDKKEFEENYDEDEMEYCDNCSSRMIMPAWKLHLQRMVLEREPLKYLETFL